MIKLSTNAQASRLLTARRKALGLTQATVASRLGISQNRFSEIEKQPSQMSLDRLLSLLGILNVELLLQERESNPPTQTEW
jgi:HTH-type transcriptional regulator/antitoxin HipB